MPLSPNSSKPWPKLSGGAWFVGHMAPFAKDPLAFLERCVREQGNFVSFSVMNRPVVLVNDHEAIEEILLTQSRNFIKTRGFSTPLTARLFGNGLLTSEGPEWMKHRRMLQPAFHRNKLLSFGNIIVSYTDELLARWKPGEVRDIHRDLTQLTTRIVVKALLNRDQVPEPIQEMEDSSLDIMKTMSSQRSGWRALLTFIPPPGEKRLGVAIDKLDTFIYEMLADRRRSQSQEGDILSMMLEARDDEGKGFTDEEARDQIMTLLGAGLDTTVLALSWTCYLLADHPKVANALSREVRDVLGDRAPSVQDLPALPYTDAVMKEGMRLYPPAWIMARQPVEDCELGGYPLAKGTPILVSQWLKHRDPRFFENPNAFVPERWLNRAPLPKFAYFPFGGGPRLCIGSGFAMLEAPLALARIAQRFRFTCHPGYQVTPWASITLQPRGGIQLGLEKA